MLLILSLLLTTKPAQFRMDDKDQIGVVQYYVRLEVDNVPHNIAIIVPFGPPDPFLYRNSMTTCYSCLAGEEPVAVDVKDILSVVAMVPHKPAIPNQPPQTRFYLAEQIMLDVLDNTHIEGNVDA
jgi:hypothetical protein